MKRITLFRCILLLLIICGSISAQNYIYDFDSSYIFIDCFDSLAIIQSDSGPGQSAEEYALSRVYLQDDFDFLVLGERFFVFGIEPGYTYSDLIEELMYDTSVAMVNPVPRSGNKAYYITNRILAKPLEGYAEQQIHDIMNSHDLIIYDSLEEEDKVYIAEYQGIAFSNLFEICNGLFEEGAFRYVTPDFIYTPEFLCSMPQDPYFGEQWHLHNTGQTGGTVDADIDMPEAWDLLSESSPQVMAILDYGFDMDHEDVKEDWCYWPYDVIGETYYYNRPWIPDNNPQPPNIADIMVKIHGTMM